jgi:hypothetical protein
MHFYGLKEGKITIPAFRCLSRQSVLWCSTKERRWELEMHICSCWVLKCNWNHALCQSGTMKCGLSVGNLDLEYECADRMLYAL